ncbi:MAG: hypothetical protein J5585_04950 [Clostridia bacterium]|nr:hypothetical protein [Clostridia bacterium]
MKEQLRFCILLLLTVVLAIQLCGCAKTDIQAENDPVVTEENIDSLEIKEGMHQREENYMAVFDTHMISAGSFTMHMEDRIYEEAALRDAAKKLQSDLAAFENTTGVKPESVTVYIVSSIPDGCPQIVGSQVFCRPADLESGAYREALAGAVYSLPCVWQRVGLTEFAFGEETNIDLKDYYADGAHALTASCSAIHLSPVLSDAETVSAARKTAKSLTAYVLENNDFAVFRETADPGSLLGSWSDYLGISPAMSLPARSFEMAELTLTTSNGNDCVLRVKNFTVTISENSWLIDPDGVYNWFCDFFDGMEMVIKQIAAEAPSSLAVAEKRYAEPISIIFGDIDTYTYAYPTQNKIVLTKDNAIWHEMVHLLLEETVVIREQVWIEEALAEHFSYAAQTRYAPTRYYSEGFDAYLRFFEEVSGKEAEADDLLFHDQVWKLYQTFRTETDTDDNEAYCRAYGIVSLISDGRLDRTQVRMLYDKSIAYKRGEEEGSKELNGSALTYPEAVVMFEYLCEQYGTDDVIDVFLNGNSIEKTFGISYSEYFTTAIDYYSQHYAALLSED